MTGRSKRDVADLEALVVLEFEILSLRTSVELAKTLQDAVVLSPVKHPALGFAIDKGISSVVENIVLRLTEALEAMHRVRRSLDLSPLFHGSGRERRPTSQVMRLISDVRQQRVAHRVQFGFKNQTAWNEVLAMYQGNVWQFIADAISYFPPLLVELREAGAYNDIKPPAMRRAYQLFDVAEVQELIKAANLLPIANSAPRFAPYDEGVLPRSNGEEL